MSWQLVSFLILGIVLLGGFAWYERSRPPAQVVALVAALAALAIAGRIAFAAFPNVKPTTDIVIFAGYALGPAAGFAVGALSALVSNFWFGQGPWTPWQMAAWGLCGILGAALALGSRNVGRLDARRGLRPRRDRLRRDPQLLADGDLRRRALLGALRPLREPRDPVRSRPCGRQRRLRTGRRPGDDPDVDPIPRTLRMEPRRTDRVPTGPRPMLSARRRAARCRPARSPPCSSPSSCSAPSPRPAPRPPPARGPQAAAAWLESAQNEDGGYGESKGASSAQEMTGWAMLGLEAAGINPQDVTSDGQLAGRIPAGRNRRRAEPG